MSYTVYLSEEKIKPHQVTTLHLICGLAFMVTGTIVSIYNLDIRVIGMLMLILGLSILFMSLFRNRRFLAPAFNRFARMVELATCVLFAGYALFSSWKFPAAIFGCLGAAVAFSLFWERQSTARLVVTVNEHGVRFPVTSRGRMIPWWEIEHILMRHGTLTVECIDNRLFQWTIDSQSFNNSDFELYCTSRILDAFPMRAKNSW